MLENHVRWLNHVKSLFDHHVLMVKSAYFLLVDLVDSCPKVLHLGGGWTLKVTVIYPSRQTENVGPFIYGRCGGN
jgi:hypothetical protein